MGIFFAILAPAIFAANNFFDKFFLEKYNLSPVTMTIINALSGFIAGILILFFTGIYVTTAPILGIILFSGFLMILCVFVYYKALFLDETSRVIPLFQFTPIFVLIMGFVFLGEQLSLKQYIGSFIIIFASFMISLEKLDLKIFSLRPAFWLMMLSSFLYAFSLVLYKFGVEEIPFLHTLPYEGMGMLLGALAVFLYKSNRNVFLKEVKHFKKNTYLLLAANESIYVSARYTTYFALSLLSASIVNILLGFQPIFGLIIGVCLSLWLPTILKEVLSKEVLVQKTIAIVLIFVGLYLIFS
jgi:drug/metabolite transporter (DMT)-like permease